MLFHPTFPSTFGILESPLSLKITKRGEKIIIIRKYRTLFKFMTNRAMIGAKNIIRIKILIIHAKLKSLRVDVSSSRILNS